MIDQTPLLGTTPGSRPLPDRESIALASAGMVSQARYQLQILSRELDRGIYEQPAFLEALKQLAIRSSATRIRILLQDNARVLADGHRLIELSRRLSSSIDIHKPAAEHRDHPENFLLVDGTGYVYQRLDGSREATADYRAPARVRLLLALFERIWERSEPDLELRRLYL